jgi:hypothetical protein
MSPVVLCVSACVHLKEGIQEKSGFGLMLDCWKNLLDSLQVAQFTDRKGYMLEGKSCLIYNANRPPLILLYTPYAGCGTHFIPIRRKPN